MLYDDGLIACDDDALVIRRYYPWGDKRVPYRVIESLTRRTLSPLRGQWRIWGSGDFVHWYNLDHKRPQKSVSLELNLGGRVRPTITPDDPDAVERILTEHLGR
jgi:hypothetical protein